MVAINPKLQARTANILAARKARDEDEARQAETESQSSREDPGVLSTDSSIVKNFGNDESVTQSPSLCTSPSRKAGAFLMNLPQVMPLMKISERNSARPSRTSRKSFMSGQVVFGDESFRGSMVSSPSQGSLASENDIDSGGLREVRRRIRRVRLQLWLFLEDPWDTLFSCTVSLLLVIAIVLSIWHSIYKSSSWDDITCPDKTIPPGTVWDNTFNAVFAVDTSLRFWAYPVHSKFLREPKNAIDVASLVPFIINHVVAVPRIFPALASLRWMVVFDASLRFLKLSRYIWGWQLLFHSISTSARALVLPFLFLLVIVLFGSCSLYLFEALEALHGYGEGITIKSLPDTIHFVVLCILTMSVGPFYGMEAQSPAGQLVALTIVFFGMLFMAMPIAIVGACFSQTWFDQDRIVLLNMVRNRLEAQGYLPQDLRDVFDEVDADESGEIELGEFRRMIETFNFPQLNPAKCRRLFAYFDHDSDGAINFSDFACTLYPDLTDLCSECDSEDMLQTDAELDACQEKFSDEQIQPTEIPEPNPPPPPAPFPRTRLSEVHQAPCLVPEMPADPNETYEATQAARASVQSAYLSDEFLSSFPQRRTGRGSVMSHCSQHTPVDSVMVDVHSTRQRKDSKNRGSQSSQNDHHVRFSNAVDTSGKDKLEHVIARMEKKIERQLLAINNFLRNEDQGKVTFGNHKGFFIPPNLPNASAVSSRAHSRRASVSTTCGSRRASANNEPRTPTLGSKSGSRRPSLHVEGSRQSPLFAAVLSKWQSDSKQRAVSRRPSELFFNSVQPNFAQPPRTQDEAWQTGRPRVSGAHAASSGRRKSSKEAHRHGAIPSDAQRDNGAAPTAGGSPSAWHTSFAAS